MEEPQTLSPAGRGRVGRGSDRPGEGAARQERLTPLARQLRREQAGPERLLWWKLRARRLCGWRFRRQFPIGRFIVDFCCPDAWLIIELDGGQHSADDVVARDADRTRALEANGYLLLRFWNREVIDNLDGVCETILATLERRG